MEVVQQGELLKLENLSFTILVLSKDFFNRTGFIIACPVFEKADPDALHIAVRSNNISGIALIEQLKSMDLRPKHYKRLDKISYDQIQNISDAVQSIFDYYPYSV